MSIENNKPSGCPNDDVMDNSIKLKNKKKLCDSKKLSK